MMGGGDATKGSTLYGNICLTCHGSNAEGTGGPNITMSMTAGIGSWTYAQFYQAGRNATNKDGRPLCVFMTPVKTTDASDCGVQDIYAYLKTKPNIDTVNFGTYCPH
jgi:hypothetical protein